MRAQPRKEIELGDRRGQQINRVQSVAIPINARGIGGRLGREIELRVHSPGRRLSSIGYTSCHADAVRSRDRGSIAACQQRPCGRSSRPG